MITGYKNKSKVNKLSADFVNELSRFYARFETVDFSEENSSLSQFFEQELLKVPLSNVLDGTLYFSESKVRKVLNSVKINKATGPDGVSNRTLKMCSQQLAPVLRQVFLMIFDSGLVPCIWKESSIFPVPKITNAKDPNDFRPIALTSNIMKCFERLILTYLLEQTKEFMDPFQFAYRPNRSVEDAVLVYLHKIHEHLDKPKTYARSLFADFSSAFNTIAPHLLARKLIGMNVDLRLIRCIHNFLIGRTQYVKASGHQSSTVTTYRGAPQGCVLSPVLFSLYTSDCVSSTSCCSILKYADDTVIIALLSNRANDYFSQVDEFTQWCDDHYLTLNTTKTKEMVIDFRRNGADHENVIIHNQVIEQVDSYKYLGTVIDDKLSWRANVQSVYKKANKRLFFLRKLKSFHIDATILTLFYNSVIKSVLLFNIICSFGNLSKQDKKKLERPRKIAQRIIGVDLASIESHCTDQIVEKVRSIMKDASHPLHSFYSFNRSGIRLRPAPTRLSRFRNSFVPDSIHQFNSQVQR